MLQQMYAYGMLHTENESSKCWAWKEHVLKEKGKLKKGEAFDGEGTVEMADMQAAQPAVLQNKIPQTKKNVSSTLNQNFPFQCVMCHGGVQAFTEAFVF